MSNMLSIRKCGFSDCEKQIGWEATECNNCWNRKENYVCDACCQKQSYNISYLIGVRDFIDSTEIFLKRIRRLIPKIPKFSDKLKEVEKSLILTDEEKQAEKKNHSFRINFLQEKNGGRQRDNIHLFKLCRECLDELAEKEKTFFSENPDVKKVGEKWDNNRMKHSEIFRQIADEIGEEEWKRIWEENDKELGLKVEEEKNSEKEKLDGGKFPTPAYQEEGVWELMERHIKGENGKEAKPKNYDQEKPKWGKGENNNYNTLTQQELNKEIKKLKVEIEEIKNSKNISGSERQIELKKREKKLAELERQAKVNNTKQNSKSENTFPISWVVGGGVIFASLLTAAILLRKHKLRKSRKN